MNTKKYIKVTTKGGANYILLAGNEDFYRSQGATISQPTEAEILAAFPEEASIKRATEERNKVEDLKKTVERKQKANDELIGKLAERDAKIEELTKELEAAKTADPSEELTEAKTKAENLEKENDELRQENAKLKEENEALKKAAKPAKKETTKK